MKSSFVIALALVAACALVVDAKTLANSCVKACTFNYDPICAAPSQGSDKPLSFGNECVLDNYNCENDKKFVVKSRGECPGAGGVRLS